MNDPSKRAGISAVTLAVLVIAAYFAWQFLGIKPQSGEPGSSEKIEIPRLIRWVSPHEASAAASKSRKKIFCYFTVAACRPCRQMEELVLGNTELCDYINARFVPVIITYDESLPDSAAEKIVSKNYEVFNFPTLIITDADGRKLAERHGFMDKTEIIKLLSEYSGAGAKKRIRP